MWEIKVFLLAVNNAYKMESIMHFVLFFPVSKF